jgi:hypothetical protein
MRQEKTPGMRLLTRSLMVYSTTDNLVGDKSTIEFSGELLQKGTSKSDQLRPPLGALIFCDDKHVLALLLDHCLELRVVAVNRTMTNSSELPLLGEGDRERD